MRPIYMIFFWVSPQGDGLVFQNRNVKGGRPKKVKQRILIPNSNFSDCSFYLHWV